MRELDAGKALLEALGKVRPLPSNLETPDNGRPGSETQGRQEVGAIERHLMLLTTVSREHSEALAQNTTALLQGATNSAGGGGAESKWRDAASSVAGQLTRGNPILPSLLKLFGGNSGGGEAVPPLTRYVRPEAIRLEAALDAEHGGLIVPIDYDAQGQARAIRSTGSSMTGSPVVVNVQAMDARSFLDHSAEIARAVREAMLHSHPINDVMSEL
jgi:hypothetical protein